jgi:chemotaxis protein histidine kinase CheA
MLIQEMHPRIAHLPGIGGISTLGTDRIVIVIDPDGLFDLARRSLGTGLGNHPASQISQTAQGGGSTVSNE